MITLSPAAKIQTVHMTKRKTHFRSITHGRRAFQVQAALALDKGYCMHQADRSFWTIVNYDEIFPVVGTVFSIEAGYTIVSPQTYNGSLFRPGQRQGIPWAELAQDLAWAWRHITLYL